MSTNRDDMNTYIASNDPGLAELLSRIAITDDARESLITPITSPQQSYEQRLLQRSPTVRSPSQTSSNYSDPSFERIIAGLDFEEITRLSGREIIDISDSGALQ